MMRARQLRGRGVSAIALLALAFVAIGCVGAEEARGWAPPVDAGNTVLIQDERGTLAALRIEGDAATAAWTYPTDDDEVDLVALYATPLVDSGVVYLASYSGLVVALNVETGRPADTWPGPVNLNDHIVATPVLNGERLTVLTEDGHVRHIDTNTGTLSPVLEELGERIWGSPADAGDTLYVGSLARAIFAVDAATGERRWQADLPGAVAGDVVIEGDVLLVGTFDRQMRALDIASEGAERWAFAGTSWFWSRPIMEPDTIYAASVGGQVVALDPTDGSERWQTTLDLGEIRAAPALAENTLVIATRDGYLVGLDPANGTRRWEQSLPDTKLLADPLVLDSGILYLTGSGTLIRINPTDGQLQQLYERG